MKFKIPAYVVLIVLIALLQPTLLEYFKISGVKPNLPVIFIVSAALIRGSAEGAAAGFFSGLAQDMLGGKVLGPYALMGLYLGLAVGSLNRRLYRENVFVAVITTFFSTIIYEALLCLFNLFVFNASARINVHAINALKRVILLEAAYNGVFSVFIYMFLMKLNHRYEEAVKTSRKY